MFPTEFGSIEFKRTLSVNSKLVKSLQYFAREVKKPSKPDESLTKLFDDKPSHRRFLNLPIVYVREPENELIGTSSSVSWEALETKLSIEPLKLFIPMASCSRFGSGKLVLEEKWPYNWFPVNPIAFIVEILKSLNGIGPSRWLSPNPKNSKLYRSPISSGIIPVTMMKFDYNVSLISI